MYKKNLIMLIIGSIIIGLCILWMIYWIKIYWPVITGEIPFGLGLKVMEVMGPLSGMILGGLLVLLGIESKKLRGLFLIISSSILIGLIIYDFLVISLLIDFSNFFLLLHFPIVMLIFGFIFLFEKHRKPIIKEGVVRKVEVISNVAYKLRKPIIKESRIEMKIHTILYILGCIPLTAGIYFIILANLTTDWMSWKYGGWGVFLIFICIALFCIGNHISSKNGPSLKIIKEKKEGIETKMKAAPNVTYMLRIEKEVGESGAEKINYICGYCGLKNNLKTIDEDRGIFQCLNCRAENHLLNKTNGF